MSALLAPSQPAPRRLRSVPAPAVRPLGGIGFLLVVAVVLGLGMFGLLAVSAQLQEQSFTLSQLKADAKRLGDRSDLLQAQVQKAESPSGLAEAAGDLGMVPANNPSYLMLGDGRVVTSEGKDTRGFQYVRTPRQQRADAEAAIAAKAKAEAEAKAKAAEAEAKAQAAVPAAPPKERG